MLDMPDDLDSGTETLSFEVACIGVRVAPILDLANGR